MKILITGASGQLGKELNNQLCTVDNVELLLTDVGEMDITSIDSVKKVMNGFNPDVVINCAAHTAVDLCEDDVSNAFLINQIGAENLAIVSNENNASIVQVSTDYVYDGLKGSPYCEDDVTNPQNVYGESKLKGELSVIRNNARHFIVRTAWLYGEGKNFVRTMLSFSEKVDKLKVVNDQTGSPTSTKELAKAIIALIDTEHYGIYHGTCEGYCTWYDFAVEIFKLSNISIEVEPCTSQEFVQKAKRPEYSVLVNNSFDKNLNYKFADWKIALKEYLETSLKTEEK